MKTKPAFIYILAIVSILGFVSTAIISFSNFDVGNYFTSIMFILIGLGLVIEGQIRNILKMRRGGLTGDEISHITASVIGIIAMGFGVINLIAVIFSFNTLLLSETFNAVKGILSLISIGIISIETWVVN